MLRDDLEEEFKSKFLGEDEDDFEPVPMMEKKVKTGKKVKIAKRGFYIAS